MFKGKQISVFTVSVFSWKYSKTVVILFMNCPESLERHLRTPCCLNSPLTSASIEPHTPSSLPHTLLGRRLPGFTSLPDFGSFSSRSDQRPQKRSCWTRRRCYAFHFPLSKSPSCSRKASISRELVCTHSWPSVFVLTAQTASCIFIVTEKIAMR